MRSTEYHIARRAGIPRSATKRARTQPPLYRALTQHGYGARTINTAFLRGITFQLPVRANGCSASPVYHSPPAALRAPTRCHMHAAAASAHSARHQFIDWHHIIIRITKPPTMARGVVAVTAPLLPAARMLRYARHALLLLQARARARSTCTQARAAE